MVYICVECDLRGRLHELKGARLPVLMAIALHTDGKTSWPTFDTIMQETGLARPTVAKAITDLEAGGWISVKREHRKPSVYQLLTSQIHMNGNGSKSEPKDGSRVHKVNSNGSETELNKVQKLNSMSKETELQEDTIEEDTTEEETKEEHTQPDGCPWCVRPRREVAGVQYLLQQWHNRYKAVHGFCPEVIPARDGAVLKELRKSNTDAVLVGLMQKYLESKDEYYVKHGYPLTVFRSSINALKMGGNNGRNRQAGAGRSESRYAAIVQAKDTDGEAEAVDLSKLLADRDI